MTNPDYYYLIPDNPYRHALDETHSPYSGYDMTACGVILHSHETVDDNRIPICPVCADYYSTDNQIKRLERKLSELNAQIERQIKYLSTR